MLGSGLGLGLGFARLLGRQLTELDALALNFLLVALVEVSGGGATILPGSFGPGLRPPFTLFVLAFEGFGFGLFRLFVGFSGAFGWM